MTKYNKIRQILQKLWNPTLQPDYCICPFSPKYWGGPRVTQSMSPPVTPSRSTSSTNSTDSTDSTDSTALHGTPPHSTPLAPPP